MAAMSAAGRGSAARLRALVTALAPPSSAALGRGEHELQRVPAVRDRPVAIAMSADQIHHQLTLVHDGHAGAEIPVFGEVRLERFVKRFPARRDCAFC